MRHERKWIEKIIEIWQTLKWKNEGKIHSHFDLTEQKHSEHLATTKTRQINEKPKWKLMKFSRLFSLKERPNCNKNINGRNTKQNKIHK